MEHRVCRSVHRRPKARLRLLCPLPNECGPVTFVAKCDEYGAFLSVSLPLSVVLSHFSLCAARLVLVTPRPLPAPLLLRRFLHFCCKSANVERFPVVALETFIFMLDNVKSSV